MWILRQAFVIKKLRLKGFCFPLQTEDEIIFQRVIDFDRFVTPDVQGTPASLRESAWNEFVLAALFLDDVGRYTLPVTLQQSVGGFDPDWGAFAAGSLIVSLPVIGLFFVVQRQLVSGLASGAVKG